MIIDRVYFTIVLTTKLTLRAVTMCSFLLLFLEGKDFQLDSELENTSASSKGIAQQKHKNRNWVHMLANWQAQTQPDLPTCMQDHDWKQFSSLLHSWSTFSALARLLFVVLIETKESFIAIIFGRSIFPCCHCLNHICRERIGKMKRACSN